MTGTRVRRATGVLLATSFVSCAAFRDGTLPPVTDWPPPTPATKQAINVEVTGNVVGDLKRAWTTQTVQAMKASGLFASVTSTTRTDAPLRATVRVTYKKTEERGFATLSAFTLFLIPVPAGHGSFTVETTVFDRGRTMGSITRTEGCTVWLQLFLIFAAPFATEDSAYYDSMRSTLVEASRRQWFGNTRPKS